MPSSARAFRYAISGTAGCALRTSCGVSKTMMLKDGDIVMMNGKMMEKQP